MTTADIFHPSPDERAASRVAATGLDRLLDRAPFRRGAREDAATPRASCPGADSVLSTAAACVGDRATVAPGSAAAPPLERRAPGRNRHAHVAVVAAADGRSVVYAGGNARGGFLYRFASPAACEDNGKTFVPLDGSQLCAAHFNDDMTGVWLPLTHRTTGMADAAQVGRFIDAAAAAVGATIIGHPEWISAFPKAPMASLALAGTEVRGGARLPIDTAGPRAGDLAVRVVRWFPDGGDHGADGFRWDVRLLVDGAAGHDAAAAAPVNVALGLTPASSGMRHGPSGAPRG